MMTAIQPYIVVRIQAGLNRTKLRETIPGLLSYTGIYSIVEVCFNGRRNLSDTRYNLFP